jgi:hypothetical protein
MREISPWERNFAGDLSSFGETLRFEDISRSPTTSAIAAGADPRQVIRQMRL